MPMLPMTSHATWPQSRGLCLLATAVIMLDVCTTPVCARPVRMTTATFHLPGGEKRELALLSLIKPFLDQLSEIASEEKEVTVSEWQSDHAKGDTGHIADVPLEMDSILKFVRANDAPEGLHVCEIGFNAGHSAAVWLGGWTDSTYTAFDLGDSIWSSAGTDVMDSQFGIRFEYIKGAAGNGNALLKFHKEIGQGKHRPCHVLSVDGAHDAEQAFADFSNGKRITVASGWVFANDVSEQSFPGVVEAWKKAQSAGIIKEVECIADPEPKKGFFKRWCWGRYTQGKN